MSWNSETWAQDDDKNFCFPFIQDGGLASQADFSHSKTIWKFYSSVNFGFPFIVTTEKIPQDTPSFPIFSSFSFSGIGADFKTVSESETVSLPEELHFRFSKSDTITFQFPENQLFRL